MSERVEDGLWIRGGSRGRCPYCRDDCTPDDDNVVCNECLARHHRGCWEEGGDRCAGCRSTVAAGAGGAASGRRVELAPPAVAPKPSPGPERRSVRPLGGGLGDLPPDVAARLESELEKGEQVLWAGQPARALLVHVAATLPMVLFAIPWTAFAVFWVGMATWGVSQAGPGPQLCFPLFGVPFVLVGLGMLSSPYWALKAASRTGYAVTDRRVIVCETNGWGTSSTRTYGPEELRSMDRVEHRAGHGDLVIEVERGHKGHVTRRGLLGLQGAREVEALIRAALL
ncbi:MAG: hypothetical protein KF878_19630 [Planctomycetes bacterium]|nr:hypothetical protein [Planctomycetota bacterium]